MAEQRHAFELGPFQALSSICHIETELTMPEVAGLIKYLDSLGPLPVHVMVKGISLR